MVLCTAGSVWNENNFGLLGYSLVGGFLSGPVGLVALDYLIFLFRGFFSSSIDTPAIRS